MSARKTFKPVDKDDDFTEYLSEDGHRMAHNGAHWVLYAPGGRAFDHHQYRHDLAEANGFGIKYS